MKVGDVVGLKGGSPPLTVVFVDENHAEVAWFPVIGVSHTGKCLVGETLRQRFPIAALEPYPEDDDNESERVTVS